MYKQLISIQKLQRATKKGLRDAYIPTNWLMIYHKLTPLATQYDLPWPNITSPSVRCLNVISSVISDLYKVHMIAIKFEEDKHKSKQIKAALKRRCENFHDDQSKMFDSILGRKRQTIILDRYLDNSIKDLGLLTAAEEVKCETNRYF